MQTHTRIRLDPRPVSCFLANHCRVHSDLETGEACTLQKGLRSRAPSRLPQLESKDLSIGQLLVQLLWITQNSELLIMSAAGAAFEERLCQQPTRSSTWNWSFDRICQIDHACKLRPTKATATDKFGFLNGSWTSGQSGDNLCG